MDATEHTFITLAYHCLRFDEERCELMSTVEAIVSCNAISNAVSGFSMTMAIGNWSANMGFDQLHMKLCNVLPLLYHSLRRYAWCKYYIDKIICYKLYFCNSIVLSNNNIPIVKCTSSTICSDVENFIKIRSFNVAEEHHKLVLNS